MGDQTVNRRLVAIFYADVAGYSRLTGVDEVGTHEALRTGLAILTKAIETNGGRVNHYAGDAILAEFGSVVDCVTTAIHAQRSLAAENEDVVEDKRLEFRIGINLGEVIVDGNEIYGDGVNIAARLESLAETGGICVSGNVADQVRHRIDVDIEDMGDHQVKNIDLPVRAYHIVLERSVTPAKSLTSDKPSIAVLPFDNLSNDPDQEYFSDGITEDIITALSRLSWLHVTARNSTFSYKGQYPNVRDVAKDLDVRYVLEGSVRKSGDRIRITAQLIEGASGNHLWADRYDRELDDMFAVQDEITGTVVRSMESELSGAEQTRALAKHPQNLDAWDLCQRGMYHYNKNNFVDAEQSITLFRKAFEIDPNLGLAYQGQAIAISIWSVGSGKTDLLDEGLRAGNKAVECDRDEPNSYSALGCILYVNALLRDANFEESISALEQELELNPNSVASRHFLARSLMDTERAEDALVHLETALRLSPRDVHLGITLAAHGMAYFLLGDYEKSVEWTSKSKRAQHNLMGPPLAGRIVALDRLGRHDEARAELKEAKSRHLDIINVVNNWKVSYRDDLISGLEDVGD